MLEASNRCENARGVTVGILVNDKLSSKNVKDRRLLIDGQCSFSIAIHLVCIIWLSFGTLGEATF